MNLNLSLRQKELLTSAFIIVLFAGTLGAAEAALWIKQLSTFGVALSVEKSKKYQVDPETGLRRPVPGSVHGKISYNSLGFRSPELSTDKPAATVRVAFLGSSTTNDSYVTTLENTWPSVTMSILQARFPQCNFDYLNAGAPGLSTRWLSVYYEEHIRELSPDIIIVLTNDQNVDLDRVARAKGVFDGDHYRPSWLEEHSLFWGKFKKNTRIISLQRSAHNPAGKLEFTEEELLEGFEPRLERLIQEVSASDAIPVLLNVVGKIHAEQSKSEQAENANTALFYMPYMTVHGLLKSRQIYNESINRLADEHNAVRFDPRGVVPGDSVYFKDSAHFTEKGSRLMGQFVGEQIIVNQRLLSLINARGGHCAN